MTGVIHKNENVITLGLIAVVLIVVSFYTWSVVKKNSHNSVANSPAAISFSNASGSPYTDLDGNPIALTDYIGEVLVVNSWASWCPACANELVELTNLSQTYKEKGVRVVAINRSEPKTTIQSFLNFIGLTDELTLVLDVDDRYFKSINGYAMPETVIYDKRGKIIHHQTGEMTPTEIRHYIDVALNQSN